MSIHRLLELHDLAKQECRTYTRKRLLYARLVREEGRRTVTEFVRTWLLLRDQWRADRSREIKVIFPDEAQDPAALGPTIRLERD